MVKGTANPSDGQWSWAQGLPGLCQPGSTADGPSSGPATGAVAAAANFDITPATAFHIRTRSTG